MYLVSAFQLAIPIINTAILYGLFLQICTEIALYTKAHNFTSIITPQKKLQSHITYALIALQASILQLSLHFPLLPTLVQYMQVICSQISRFTAFLIETNVISLQASQMI